MTFPSPLLRNILLLIVVGFCHSTALHAADQKAEKSASPDYQKQIAPILTRYCVGCHNAEDKEGKLNLESFPALMKGGENGKILTPGNPTKSKMIAMVQRKTEPFMPPEGNEAPTKKEIALLVSWVKAGAVGPKSIGPNIKNLITPKIRPLGKVRRPVSAMSSSPDGRFLAVARHTDVEILNPKTRKVIRTLKGHQGNIAALAFSRNGKRLFVGSGEPGLYGQTTIWSTANWKQISQSRGHRDTIYSLAASPDGKTFATGSYDKTIWIWNAQTGKKQIELTGHNGPVNGLSYHPTGKILASASGDRTVKLWDVKSGKRLDTLGQPEKAQNAVAFSPDGRYVVAGGVDNRLRVWEITKMGLEGTTRLLYSRFAHELSILDIEFSPDGKTLVTSGEDLKLKIWKVPTFRLARAFAKQSDWPVTLSISADSNQLFVGRMDGSLAVLPLSRNLRAVADATPVRLAPVPKTGLSTKPLSKTQEREPNDLPKQATALKIPGSASGVLAANSNHQVDADLYRFSSRKGQTWIIETNAARSKSPADTKIEVLHADGRPVLRYLMRAIRDSYITFRPIDSRQNQVRVKNWEEMKLNQYLYMGGEIGRLFRAPRGPDSGFQFYTQGGKRRCYFDTSATVHAKDDPVYIVEPYAPGTKLEDNGLPIFPLYYANDDDGERKLGSDSRLTFTAPHDGEFLVRVTDVRNQGGPQYKYTLTIRPPKPDFQVSLNGKNATIPSGSGRRLTVNVNRIDGFNGKIRVDISGMPVGFTVTSPIILEPDHLTTHGVIHVSPDVPVTATPKKSKSAQRTARKSSKPKTKTKKPDWSKVRVTATAWINGQKVVKPLGNLGQIKVAPRPKVRVWLEVDPESVQAKGKANAGELTIAPGTTITALLRIDRHGYNGDLKFEVDHLPHGIIVDNIGLSGILVRAGETRRIVYLTAADWVKETTHQIHAVGLGQGNPASPPIVLHVRKDIENVSRTATTNKTSDKP